MRKPTPLKTSVLSDLYRGVTLQSLVRGYGDEAFVVARNQVRQARRLESLLPHQRAFLEDSATRHLGLVAGFGAGKSFALSAKMLQLAEDNPGYVGIAMEPTFGMLSDILVPQTIDLWDSWGVDYTYHKGASEFEVRNADGSTSRCLLRSFENVARIRGINASWALVDEIDTVKPQAAVNSFRLLQGRIRTGIKPQIAVACTPEGFGWMHGFFVESEDPSKRLIRAKTTDNPHLPETYVQSLREQYPPELIEAYLNGEFVNLAQSNIFSSYDRRIHTTTLTAAEHGEAVYVGLDFNIGNSHGCFGVFRQEGGRQVLHIFGEYKLKDTFEVARHLQQKFPAQTQRRVVTCYPDASGGAASTSSTKSDHQILREAGLTVHAERKNPPVAETISHVNSLFHRGLIRVNERACPNLAISLERWAYDQAGHPQKGGATDYSHAGDALRYLVWGSCNGNNRTHRSGYRVY
jgi:hypothetical protein